MDCLILAGVILFLAVFNFVLFDRYNRVKRAVNMLKCEINALVCSLSEKENEVSVLEMESEARKIVIDEIADIVDESLEDKKKRDVLLGNGVEDDIPDYGEAGVNMSGYGS